MVKQIKIVEEKITKKESKTFKKDYINAVGRRKEAIARVRLYVAPKDIVWGQQAIKKGDMFVNQKPIDVYFSGSVSKVVYEEPFKITNTLNKFTLTMQVSGGGSQGQLDAGVLAIARALIKHDPTFRPILKKKGMLTRDARIRERRKVGTGGKARRKKQSPKR